MSARAPTGTATRPRSTDPRGTRGPSTGELRGSSPGPVRSARPSRAPAATHRGHLLGVLLESAVAVLAVSLFLGVLLGWFGQPPVGQDGPTPGVRQAVRAAPVLWADPGGAVAASASKVAEELAAGQSGASPSPSPAPSSTSSSASSSNPAAPVAVPAVPVAVLNATHVEGLAARTARHLRAAGWTVPVVDDFVGEVAQTTVFHPEGAADAASVLAAALGVEHVRPATSAMNGKHLTVVLASEPRLGR